VGNQHAVLDRAQEAARKAREELVKGGEGVTAWKVAQAVLVALKADSWDSLGVQPQDVPLLRDLFLIEGKVSTCSLEWDVLPLVLEVTTTLGAKIKLWYMTKPSYLG
jgi:hypothetical protein